MNDTTAMNDEKNPEQEEETTNSFATNNDERMNNPDNERMNNPEFVADLADISETIADATDGAQEETLQSIAENFRKNEQWIEAAAAYEKLWKENEKEWDGFFWVQALRKAGVSDAALDVCRAVYSKHREFKAIHNLYALCIYDCQIKPLKEISNDALVLKALNAIQQLYAPPEQPDGFYLLNVAAWKVLRIYKDRVNFPAEPILNVLKLLDPNLLGKNCFVTQDENGKKIELASEYEDYYALKSKALLQLKQYRECIECCEEALTKLDKFHYDNDIWFKMRIARANAELGDVELAFKQQEILLSKRKEWFFQKDLAEWALKLGRSDKALKYVIEACLNHGDFDKKISVYKLAVNVFEQTGRLNDAKELVRFIVAIYNDTKKKHDPELTDRIQKYELDPAFQSPLKKEFAGLKKRWEEILTEFVPQYEGVIEKINQDGQSGFIKSGKKSYYFKTKSLVGKKELFVPGIKVVFNVEMGYDKKKDRESEVAVNIRLAEFEGVIDKFNPDGQSGFIKSGQKTYHFETQSLVGKKELFVPGIKVVFNVKMEIDKKKDRESEVAVNIRLAK